MSDPETTSCQQVLSKLITQLQQVLEHQPQQQDAWLQQRQSLALAHALLEHSSPEAEQQAQHIVVVGPTQVGKSSVINHLLGDEYAGVSALAGYTRHAQGFSSSAALLNTDAPRIFPDWEMVAQEQLDQHNTKQYSLSKVAEPKSVSPNPSIYWDTPDFDSVSSRSYRTIVPNLCAIASVLVLVLSKEKYADNSVWEFLKMLAPLQLPLIICLNKMDPAHAPEISVEIETRLAEINCQHLGMHCLAWRSDDERLSSDDAQALRAMVTKATNTDTEPNIGPYFQQHQQAWLAAVRTQHHAESEWQETVRQVSDEFLQYYRNHYLQQQRYSEALQRAITKLLELLEIPILAGTLGSLRKVITWPVRTLGRTVLNTINNETQTSQSNESIILNEALEQSMAKLISTARAQTANTSGQEQLWWRSLDTTLIEKVSAVNQQAQQKIEQLQQSFEPEIEQAANRLYQQLQQQPATLNSLRAARVTTDAAALVLAIHTGGLSASDLVLAPALLSVTSLLTESAVGQHMKIIEKELKEKQYTQVEKTLAQEIFNQQLSSLRGEELADPSLYSLSNTELAAAEQCIAELT